MGHKLIVLTHRMFVAISSTRQLRKLYPNHSVVPLQDYGNVNLLGFPGALVQPMVPHELISTAIFVPLQRRSGQGLVVDSVEFGSFRVAWNVRSFHVLIIIMRFTCVLVRHSTSYCTS